MMGWFIAVALGLLIRGPAWAAHLELKDDQRSGQETPAQETLVPCSANANLVQNAMVSPNGQQITIAQVGEAEVEGTASDCVLSARIVGTILVAAEVMPDMGENVGDPVLACLEYTTIQSAAAEPSGAYRTTSTVGGIPPDQPFLVRRNNNTVFEDASNTIGNGERINEFACNIGARIGDIFDLRSGVDALAQGTGIGMAEADVIQSVQLSVGACAEAPLCSTLAAPAISPLHLGAIALLLAGAGGALARRRRLRR